jgi:beta-glucosidase-like glycosyl hydrolase
VVSDAFDMGGLTEHFDVGEAAIRGIEAGEDQILLSPNTDVAIAAVKGAVTSGRIPISRINQSVKRILNAKNFTGVPHADPETIFRTVDAEEHRRLAGEIARRAVTLVRQESGVLPLRHDSRIALVVVSDVQEANPLQDIERELRTRANVVEGVANADVAVVAFAVRARTAAGSIAVPPAARQLVASLKLPIIGISFGSPYLLREVPSIGTYICAYGIQPVMQIAAVNAIFGDAPFTGKLPISIG